MARKRLARLRARLVQRHRQRTLLSSGALLPEDDSGAAKAAEYNSDGAAASDGAGACGSASSGTLLPEYDSGVAKAAECNSDGAAASDGAGACGSASKGALLPEYDSGAPKDAECNSDDAAAAARAMPAFAPLLGPTFAFARGGDWTLGDAAGTLETGDGDGIGKELVPCFGVVI